ncbi:MAG TPA: UPF0715 family protein [Niallia sp.]|nr:UPF0715 family protein [Niallia sp.]
MEIWKVSEKLSRISDVIPYYFFSLILSSISFSIFMITYGLDLDWLSILSVIVISFYVCIPYLLFAIPLQIILNKRPRKFNMIYLFIYTLLSFVAVFLYNVVLFAVEPTSIVEKRLYYSLSFGAAVIYWFWDSVFLQKKH